MSLKWMTQQVARYVGGKFAVQSWGNFAVNQMIDSLDGERLFIMRWCFDCASTFQEMNQ